MRASGVGLTWPFFLLAASVASAASPAAPQVTLGADLKLLRFDWDPVPGATFYRLWIRPGGTRYISVGARIPASITHAEHAIPVHLQDWMRTRYVVTACNASGCSHSAALNPRSLMPDTIGYLKASNTDAGDGFGSSVALSDDGYTLAVSAPFESSSASDVNGDQADNTSSASGAVYVFRRRGNTWQQEAYLKAAVNLSHQALGNDRIQLGRAVALSADGSMLAVSAPSEFFRTMQDVGAVHVFQRSQNMWKVVATLRAPQPRANDNFGIGLDLSDDGRTLKVGSLLPFDERGPRYSTHIFVRPGNSWQHSVTLAPFFDTDVCPTTRLSGDGQTLVTNCQCSPTVFRIVTMKRAGDAWVYASELRTRFFDRRQPFALNADATVMALLELRTIPEVGMYRWAAGNWIREAGISTPTPENPNGPFHWGWDLALSADGRLLGIGSPVVVERGAVYLHQRGADVDTWALRNVVTSPNPGSQDQVGASISLSANGRTLAVGARLEDSSATGIDGERENEHAPNAGAAYLY